MKILKLYTINEWMNEWRRNDWRRAFFKNIFKMIRVIIEKRQTNESLPSIPSLSLTPFYLPYPTPSTKRKTLKNDKWKNKKKLFFFKFRAKFKKEKKSIHFLYAFPPFSPSSPSPPFSSSSSPFYLFLKFKSLKI